MTLLDHTSSDASVSNITWASPMPGLWVGASANGASGTDHIGFVEHTVNGCVAHDHLGQLLGTFPSHRQAQHALVTAWRGLHRAA